MSSSKFSPRVLDLLPKQLRIEKLNFFATKRRRRGNKEREKIYNRIRDEYVYYEKREKERNLRYV